METEEKKQSFRRYLEINGVIEALTKVLVDLYEENEKPSSPIEFIQQKLGIPKFSEYEKLQTEKADLQSKYDKLLKVHTDVCKELVELKCSSDGKKDTDGKLET